jgi:hypothetical protein
MGWLHERCANGQVDELPRMRQGRPAIPLPRSREGSSTQERAVETINVGQRL